MPDLTPVVVVLGRVVLLAVADVVGFAIDFRLSDFAAVLTTVAAGRLTTVATVFLTTVVWAVALPVLIGRDNFAFAVGRVTTLTLAVFRWLTALALTLINLLVGLAGLAIGLIAGLVPFTVFRVTGVFSFTCVALTQPATCRPCNQ